MTILKTTDKAATLDPERRRFLRLLGASGTAMAVAQVPFTQAASTGPAKIDVLRSTPEVPRYRETDHIRAFYATLQD